MEDHVFKRLRSDPSLFEPADGHRAIRASGYRRAPQVAEYHEEVIAEHSIAAWLDASNPRRAAHDSQSPPGQNEQWNLRLLLCSPRILDRAIWPLPLSGTTFDLLMRRWEIPSVFFKAIRRQVPIATAYEDPDDDDKSVLLLRTNISWTWQYALAATYDAITRTTSVLIIGLRADEAAIVTEALKTCLAFGGCPMLLPCILIDKCVDAVAEDAEHRRDSLIQICYSTGQHGFTTATATASSSAPGDDRDDLDLDALTTKLTALSDACAGIASVCQTQRRFIDAITTFSSLSSQPSSVTTSSSPISSPTHRRPPRGFQSCTSRLAFTSELLQGIDSKITYAKASAQGQVQTMYSLIGQRDNRINVKLADASRRIAEDGRRVALLTRRDSTDMRIVAAVTLIFLPATFTATFFSTSFFDFNPNGAGYSGSGSGSATSSNGNGNATSTSTPTAIVSSWIWLYWVVTAVLTMVVLSTWIVLVRAQHLKTAVALRRESRREEELAKRLRGRATGFTVVNTGGANERHDPLRPYLAGVPDLLPERVFGEKWSSGA